MACPLNFTPIKAGTLSLVCFRKYARYLESIILGPLLCIPNLRAWWSGTTCYLCWGSSTWLGPAFTSPPNFLSVSSSRDSKAYPRHAHVWTRTACSPGSARWPATWRIWEPKLPWICSETANIAREHQEASSQRMKRRYDMCSVADTFSRGEMVWLHNPQRKKGLSRSWAGHGKGRMSWYTE